MGKSLIFFGALVGGVAGWWIGVRIGLAVSTLIVGSNVDRWDIMSGYLMAVIGLAYGIYYGRRMVREYFE